LVLGAGGTLGEAWLRGVLNGIEAGSGVDFRECEYLLGTSAGSIVATTLAAGRRPEAGDRAAEEWARAVPDTIAEADGPRFAAVGKVARAAATPFANLSLSATAPAGRLARAVALRRAPRTERTLDGLGPHIEALGARFDGRLRIAAVDRSSGKRVMFGAPDAPRATVAQAVLASCAVPWIFDPVEIGEREYVDGGVWSPVNLDAVPAGRGSRVLALIPTAGTSITPLRTATALATSRETAALRGRGATVTTIVPDDASLKAIGPDLMDASRREAVATAGYAQGRRTISLNSPGVPPMFEM
jgi:NTE family protein